MRFGNFSKTYVMWVLYFSKKAIFLKVYFTIAVHVQGSPFT